MNTISSLNLTLWEKLGTFLDVLPKLVYLLYACLASAVDALQALVRKLAGLDYYYQTINGNADLVVSTDPLTEFIYGILGFGDSAPVYEALNTVFWSFAIFGLIVLAVSTMVAIIKSHYNEDSSQTSPWKYLYTAGKAIVSFAIMPVVVVLGLQITSFVLRTLDNITAGSGTTGEVQEMFGVQVTNAMLQEQEITYQASGDSGEDNYTYSNYDLFGSGAPSTTTTFSGMLFSAASYSSNRVRSGAYSIEQARNLITSGEMNLLGDENNPSYTALVSNDERREFIADQVDYLFQNNIYLSSSYSYSQLVSNATGVVNVWEGVSDMWAPSSITNFTKYNVSIIWIFYDLWQFNYIVGFVGVLTAFAIMISVVLGLMTRLIKGAALFLVYPALLGLAPMDNFKAFKSWGTNFMQQLMMAFGSIIGINLLLLILPYVQTINFFNIPVVDVIVQLVMLITGLLMAKDFIGLVNGFVGGADAVSAGDPMKSSIGGRLKQGVKPVTTVAGTGVRVAAKGAKTLAVGAGKTAGKYLAAKTSAIRANRQASKEKKNAAKAEIKSNDINKIVSALQSGKSIDGVNDKKMERYKNRADEIRAKEGDIYNKYLNDGDSPEKAGEKARADINKQLNDLARDMNIGGIAKLQDKRDKLQRKADKAEFKQQNIQERYKLYKGTNSDGDTKYERTYDTRKMQLKAGLEIPKQFAQDASDIGKTIADGFLKTIKSTGGLFGIDKALGGAKEVLGESLSYKGGYFEDYTKKKKEDKEKSDATAVQTRSAKNQEDILSEQKAQRQAMADIASGIKSMIKSSQESERIQRATQKAIEKLSNSFGNGNNNNNSNGTNP